jgi:hypothetical protein
MEKPSIYFFYNGIPYKKDRLSSNETDISGHSVWDDKWSYKINNSDVIFCEEDEIEKIFIENCKKEIKKSLFGWTSERAKEFEENGRQYLNKQWKYYLLECPNRVYKACQEGKYGIRYSLSTSIVLSEEFKIGNKPCSDGITRSEKDYMKFLMGEDWSLIRLFMLKWPMLKFKYVDFSKTDEPFPDIYCMVSFYDDQKVLSEIHNSMLL